MYMYKKCTVHAHMYEYLFHIHNFPLTVQFLNHSSLVFTVHVLVHVLCTCTSISIRLQVLSTCTYTELYMYMYMCECT